MGVYATGPGPSPMALGPFAFRALGFSYRDVSRELDTRWQEIEVCDRMNALQWTGPSSETLTIAGVLFPEEFGGLASLDGIRSAAKAGRPLMLVTRSGSVRGMHVIEGVSEDMSEHTRRALPRRNAYQISLKRYSGAGGGLFSFF